MKFGMGLLRVPEKFARRCSPITMVIRAAFAAGPAGFYEMLSSQAVVGQKCRSSLICWMLGMQWYPPKSA